MKANIRELLIQIVSVTFGVLIALLLNQWNEKRKLDETVETGLQSISNEIAFNKSLLQHTETYFEELLSMTDSLISQHGPDYQLNLNEFETFNPPNLKRSSFDLCLSTGIFSSVDFSRADLISVLYSYQEYYQEVLLLGVQRNMSGESKKLTQIKASVESWKRISWELQQIYNQTAAELPKPNHVLEIR